MLGGTDLVLASLVQVARLLHASWLYLVFASLLQMARWPDACGLFISFCPSE